MRILSLIPWHFNCWPVPSHMAQDIEQTLKELFGESWNRVTAFQTEQVKKLTAKLQDVAREAVKDELSKLHTEVNDLRSRVAALEANSKTRTPA